ncbi:MAG TPA: S1 RNA-binding domain-containing protein [Thermoproteota archaeon]|nr:S1 RNA-binding domain-containing protein [Thermoproteota archaeon]
MSGRLDGELLVAEVTELGEFGAVLRSEDYDGELFLHVSEIPLKREQKLTDAIKKNQVVVVKPLKEDKAAKRLFVSLKGISRSESRSRLRANKDERSARAILREIIGQAGLPSSAEGEIESRAVERFGSLSLAFRAILESGDKALTKLRAPSQVSGALKRQLEAELLKKRYREKRRIEIYFTSPDGAERLRNLGRKYVEDKKTRSSITIRTISSPRYEIIVESRRPKEAKAVAEEVVEKIASDAKAMGGNVKV